MKRRGKCGELRPFPTVGCVRRKRPFSTQAQIGLSYALNFFSRKIFTRVFLSIASLIPPPPHAHTPVPGTTQQYHFFFFFSHTFNFQSLDKPWSQVSSLLPPGSCLQFLSRIGISNPTARRFFIQCCLLTLSRFPQVNLCTRRKNSHEFIRVCTWGDSNSRN